MASSRKSSRSKSRSRDLVERIRARLSAVVSPGAQLVIGLSGGIDSMALLDCLQRLSRRLRFRLRAVHVNHQLSANAARWEAFCRRECRARKIPCSAVKVVVSPGESVEAAARAARYSVFGAQRADFVVLAQHQDDQVETMLLQLLRGAGVRGLASMPLLRMANGEWRMANGPRQRRGSRSSPITHHSSPAILRPMLDVTRAEILKYARHRGLEWIEDESNANVDIRRNFLRHKVLPLIAGRFPSYRATITRSVRHLAEAGELLDQLAEQDSADSVADGALEVAALRRLSRARARNLLRYFLARQGATLPNVEHLDEALRQVLTARQDARVAVALDGGVLQRYAGRLCLVPALSPAPHGFARPWRGERTMELPELGGVLTFRRTSKQGISLARLREHPVTIRARRGGERLRPDARRPRRSLKNLLQEARVAPWERNRLPLIYCGDTLVWAPQVGVDCAFRPRAGEPALCPDWKFTRR